MVCHVEAEAETDQQPVKANGENINNLGVLRINETQAMSESGVTMKEINDSMVRAMVDSDQQPWYRPMLKS